MKEVHILDIVQINVRSFRNHSDELSVYIADALVDIDVLILTEINVEINEPLHFRIDGYHKMYVRREGRKRGGY